MDWKSIRPWIWPTRPETEFVEPLRLSPGLRHYSRQRDGEYVRYHLRIENSGQALLIVAAVEAARLTRSGAIAAFGLLEGKSEVEITRDLGRLPTAAKVISEVRELIAQLGKPSKRYPVFNLADPLSEDVPLGLVAPFQADMVLDELSVMKQSLQALWQAGIPHVRFVGIDTHQPLTAERIDTLCSAVQFAEDIGMIAGARMRASSLVDPKFGTKLPVDRIAELGIDYVVSPWGVSPAHHEYLFGSGDLECLPALVERSNHWEFPVVLDSGLTIELAQRFEDELDKVIALEIEHVEVYPIVRRDDEKHSQPTTASTSQNTQQPVDSDHEPALTPFCSHHLRQLASWVEDLADVRRVRIIWLPPHASKAGLDKQRITQLLQNGPRAGADISIRIDPGGIVLPPRGERMGVGKIDRSNWSQIWNHACFRSFREMVSRNEHCQVCPLLTMCASHCPADQAGWAIED